MGPGSQHQNRRGYCLQPSSYVFISSRRGRVDFSVFHSSDQIQSQRSGDTLTTQPHALTTLKPTRRTGLEATAAEGGGLHPTPRGSFQARLHPRARRSTVVVTFSRLTRKGRLSHHGCRPRDSANNWAKDHSEILGWTLRKYRTVKQFYVSRGFQLFAFKIIQEDILSADRH